MAILTILIVFARPTAAGGWSYSACEFQHSAPDDGTDAKTTQFEYFDITELESYISRRPQNVRIIIISHAASITQHAPVARGSAFNPSSAELYWIHAGVAIAHEVGEYVALAARLLGTSIPECPHAFLPIDPSADVMYEVASSAGIAWRRRLVLRLEAAAVRASATSASATGAHLARNSATGAHLARNSAARAHASNVPKFHPYSTKKNNGAAAQ